MMGEKYKSGKNTKKKIIKFSIFKVFLIYFNFLMSQKIMLKGTFSIRLQCFQTVVLEKTLASPLDCKDI